MKNVKHIAICPGSFDPVTVGHEYVIRRAAEMFDTVYAAVMINSSKKATFSPQERTEMLSCALSDLENVKVICSEKLLVDLARDVGASTIVKGVRNEQDFNYEMQLAMANSHISPETDTLFVPAKKEHIFISSSVVRELAHYGADISALVPQGTAEKISMKLNPTGKE